MQEKKSQLSDVLRRTAFFGQIFILLVIFLMTCMTIFIAMLCFFILRLDTRLCKIYTSSSSV